MTRPASLAAINAAIRAADPCVELVRGDGYHYFEFDNGDWSEGKGPGFLPVAGYVVGDGLVAETESVWVPYLKQRPAARWIADGIDYGRRVREANGLPGGAA